jgi:alpha-L-fucosidase
MADGTIPEPQKQVLLEVGDWLRQNGEAIYGTRPWKIHAEGPVDKVRSDRTRHRTWVFADCDAGDIRFTCKDNTLYAVALGWPEGDSLTVKTLGTGTRVSSGGIRNVALLGSDAATRWSRSAAGLTVELPARRPNDKACALRIEVAGRLDMTAE